MAKFDKQSLLHQVHAHAHAHYICIACAKYQRASVKALVQVDFLMYALDFLMYELSKHKHNPYLIRKLSFCQKLKICNQNSSHKCSVCLYCVSIVPDCFSKSCDTS